LFSDELHDTLIRRIFRVCGISMSMRDVGRAVYTLRQFTSDNRGRKGPG